jgi:flagellar biosynthesis/type III secretory pathway M-ring protein FliF/YscJ
MDGFFPNDGCRLSFHQRLSRQTEVFRRATSAARSYIAQKPKHETMSLHLVLIAVIVLVAIIAVALLLRPVVRWLLAEWHAAKSRNYPNRLQ